MTPTKADYAVCFLDTETTGKNTLKDEIWHLAYTFDTFIGDEYAGSSGIKSIYVEHDQSPNLWTKAMSSYHETFYSGHTFNGDQKKSKNIVTQHQMINLISIDVMQTAKNVTLVCANPSFDDSFLVRAYAKRFEYIGEMPYHYRKFDIESYYAGAMQTIRLIGLSDICVELNTVNRPDHTADSDIIAMREAFYKINGRKLE